jgi:SNF2 family DNA or RNA helicase
VARIDGTVTKAQRTRVKNDFYKKLTPGQGQYDVVLAQYRSGGTGLNLTAATKTHILDEEWNPGKRDQAYGRTFRIGQDLETDVYRYVMSGTVDVWQSNLLEMKEAVVTEFSSGMKSDTDALKELMSALEDGSIM